MRVHTNLPQTDLDIDLESGGTSSEDDPSKNQSLSVDHAKKLFGGKSHGFVQLNGSRSSGHSLSSYNESLDLSHISVENVEVFSDNSGEEMMNFVDNRVVEKKKRKLNSGKPPKPPRPPVGPSLNAADMKLVKEISEYALLKRKRAKRMKELRNRRSKKSSPFYGNLFAMLVTTLFFFVIIFQGKIYLLI